MFTIRNGPLHDLFVPNTINSSKTLFGLAHALTVPSSGYESSYNLAVHLGVYHSAAQRITDKVREIMSQVAQEEQNHFQWPRGSYIEIDEASMRASRVPCEKRCNIASCGDHPHGFYRLLHRRQGG